MQLNDSALGRMAPGRQLREHSKAINSLDFHRKEDLLVTAADDESVGLWDSEAGELKKLVPTKKYGAACVTCTHHADAVITASRNDWDHTVRYLSLHDNRYLRYFKGHSMAVRGITMHPSEDRFMTAGDDGEIRLWDLRSPTCQGLLRCEQEAAVAFDEQGLIFASATSRSIVKFYDASSYDRGPFEQLSLPGSGRVHQLQFSLQGKRLLCFQGGSLHIFDSFNFTRLASFQVQTAEHTPVVPRATLSPDGEYVLAGSSSGQIRVFSIASNNELKPLSSHSSYPALIRWSYTRMLLASGSLDGELILWAPLPRE